MGIYEGTFNTPTPSLPSLSTLSTHHQGPMYDSIFVLSSGRVTSIGPQGEFNWQVRVCVYSGCTCEHTYSVHILIIKLIASTLHCVSSLQATSARFTAMTIVDWEQHRHPGVFHKISGNVCSVGKSTVVSQQWQNNTNTIVHYIDIHVVRVFIEPKSP